jgi:hypothetical protein
MSTLAPAATRISVGRLSRAIDYGDPAVTWKSVVGDLEKVRKNPERAAERAVDALTALAADGVAGEDSFVLLPDMPAPEVDVDARRRNGPVAEAPDPVKVPPPEPLTTGPSWFDAVDANPFHQGLLSGLRDYA